MYRYKRISRGAFNIFRQGAVPVSCPWLSLPGCQFHQRSRPTYKHYQFCLLNDGLTLRHYHTTAKRFSTSELADTQKWATQDDRLILAVGEEELRLPFLWLRDHCRCAMCYNHGTNQKNIPIEMVDPNISLQGVELTGNELTLTWDDGHVTSYQLSWLRENSFPGPRSEKVEKVLWNRKILSDCNLPRVHYDQFMAEDDALRTLLRSLLQYGIGLVEGVSPDLDGTQKTAERVCFIQRTLFGGMWRFSADAARGDTAYTNFALGAHTDCTYLSTPVGIQVFHCTYHDGDGGETLLVDGFKGAHDVRDEHPAAFDTLCTYRLHQEYVEPGHHLRSLDPILKVHPVTRQLECIRFNQYDRAPLSTVPTDDVKNVYSAIGTLGKTLSRPENKFWLKLRPGTVLFVDNWRVLHGRAAFTGSRHVTGCYLPRDDWIGKARILDLVWK